ncbi:uroporphyrinogen decarboxylase family protein [Mahella australiensis]|uniref:Uroporphyrinogen decarboxylase (URO-D) domain-containing protein n=1 Tax=Mahella australiensis (strain DSM 15567 / CIP 107919 / 50-1 BON) TaxID=697281 RepID=F3ZX77_MAHA5|nr:uroporphyrinogen decarboxylase family protein [Mahella australiensis]AEE96534.1 hypothetical protein Mahau_1340 [Mahella australiensis 50-1 BON]
MDSKERVIRTLKFKNPDKIPVDLWTLPATYLKYGKAFEDMLSRHERDIVSFDGPFDLSHDQKTYQPGRFTDGWGSEWMVLQAGMVGEVKKAVFAGTGAEALRAYAPPVEAFKVQWAEYMPRLDAKIKEARGKGKFIIGGWISLFERMQFLRGPENLYRDLGLQDEEIYIIKDIVMEFFREYLKAWLNADVDAIAFGDDWGSQRALLISPNIWRSFFKPLYKELFDMIKDKGKYIFFHSDGYIMDLCPEFIEMGVSAVNSQLWCMGVENVAERFAGKITFWGEISRQDILPHGTPEDIRKTAEKMKKYLFVNGGGLIGQSEVGKDVPLENIEAVLTCWNE